MDLKKASIRVNWLAMGVLTHMWLGDAAPWLVAVIAGLIILWRLDLPSPDRPRRR